MVFVSAILMLYYYQFGLHHVSEVLKDNRKVDRCVRKDFSSCDPSRITRDRRSRARPKVQGDAAGVKTRGVLPHTPVNHMVFFLCHGFIKFMYINKILMKTTLIFVYYMLQCELLCVPTSGSRFYPWVWILSVGLDFASGSGFASWSGYENPMSQTPCCIMWPTHNHGINRRTERMRKWIHRCSFRFLICWRAQNKNNIHPLSWNIFLVCISYIGINMDCHLLIISILMKRKLL